MRSLTRTPPAALLVAAVLLAPGASDAADPGPRFTRTEVDVTLPDVTLINQDGDEVKLLDLVSSDKPVFVDFIFATCTTICPILSAGYSSMQRRLDDSRDAVHLVSFTIDPEHDGPDELKSYLARYQADSAQHIGRLPAHQVAAQRPVGRAQRLRRQQGPDGGASAGGRRADGRRWNRRGVMP